MTIGTLQDGMDFVPVGGARGAAFGDDIAQCLLSHGWINDRFDLALRLSQRDLRQLEEQAGFPRYAFEVRQEDLVDALFGMGVHLMDEMQEALDHVVGEFFRPHMAKEHQQGITDVRWMAPEFVQGFGSHTKLKTSEIAGRKGDEQLLGEDKALELFELCHGDLQTRETPTSSGSFQCCQRQ